MARKILLADDSVTAQNMGRKILTDAGYEVITVNNGSAALKKISEAKPDLIVLDVYMPGYSGLEVCQRLKEAQDTSRIPVLLTVGKLEPFKPEEARRVRADSYIVKPFEASELLSALTKLEDKLVPRAESSKPGRFARSIAAIEEGRHDPAVANDEESGWKNRIAFPSKTKEKSREADDANDPAIYNPVNKDLRTVVDHSPAQSTSKANGAEAHVDLGALAAPGLPTDVTPEEIAALAAAAAQVKGSMAAKTTDPVHATAPGNGTGEVALLHPSPAPEKIDSPIEATSAGATTIDAKPDASNIGLKTELVGNVQEIQPNHDSDHNSHPDVSTDSRADEPVTMAAAAGAGGGNFISRWTAVAVALGPEEADISLETEMQKAYAALSAAEIAVSESTSAPAPQESHVSDVNAAVTHVAMPDVQPPFGEPTTASVEANGTKASEPQTPPPPSAQVMSQPAPQEQEQTAQEQASSATPDTTAVDTTTVWQHQSEGAFAEAKSEESAIVSTSTGNPHESAHGVIENTPVAAIVIESQAMDQPVAEDVQSTISGETSADQIKNNQDSAEITVSGVEAEPVHHSTGEMKKESDIAAKTAAAWANWRRTRESGDTDTPPPSALPEEMPTSVSASVPEDSAAMAVAVGAEHRPEDVTAEPEPESAEIASIVDSVLADLRPRIFEEVSRKLGKKK